MNDIEELEVEQKLNYVESLVLTVYHYNNITNIYY